MTEKHSQYLTAKNNFDRASHEYDLLTGKAKKGESFEQYQQRKEAQKQDKARKAAAALNQAEAKAKEAETKAKAAEEEKNKAAGETKKLAGAKAQADKELAAMKKKYDEAKKAGKLTPEMIASMEKAQNKAKNVANKLARS